MINKHFEQILEIQHKSAKLNLQYKGIDLWPFLRILVGYNHALEKEKISEEEINQSFKKKSIKQLIGIAWYNLKKYREIPKFKKEKISIENVDVLFLSEPERYMKHEGKYQNVWLASINKIIKKEFGAIERTIVIPFKDSDGGAYDEMIRDLEKEHLVFKNILARGRKKVFLKKVFLSLNKIFRSNSSVGLKDTQAMKEFYKLLLDSEIGATISPENLENRILNLFYLFDFYEELYAKSRPKAIVVYSYFIDFFLAAICVAKKMKIPVIEVQHGLISPFSFAYTNWNEEAKGKLAFIPDFCFTWDDYVTGRINETSNNTTRAITTGNLSREYNVLKKNENIDLLRQYKEDAKLHVLITTGYKIIPRDVIDVINKNIPNVFFHFKLHPRYTSAERLEYYKKEIQNNQVKIYSGNEVSLYDFFTFCKVHITEQSAVLMEAEEYGLNNIIVSEVGKDLYAHKINSGEYFYCENAENLYSLLLSKHIYKLKEVKNIVSTSDMEQSLIRFFKENIFR
jgi:hypothetical protein